MKKTHSIKKGTGGGGILFSTTKVDEVRKYTEIDVHYTLRISHKSLHLFII